MSIEGIFLQLLLSITATLFKAGATIYALILAHQFVAAVKRYAEQFTKG